MATQNPLSAPEAWDGVAESYAVELVPIFELYSADALALADLGPRSRVLDVAAGPGTLSLLAATRVAHVTAVDFSAAMVGLLARRAAEAGLANVNVKQCDGQHLPFDDHCFDACFSMFGLMFFPDRSAGFRELLRVLKPGGRAVVSSWSPADQVPVMAALFSAIRDLLPGLPFGGGKAPLSTVEDFHEEMSLAGFNKVHVQTVQHSISFPSIRDFWESQTRSSAPVALLKKKLEQKQWGAFTGDLLCRLERRFGSGPVEVTWPAHLGAGVR